jgi:hypothetical protein
MAGKYRLHRDKTLVEQVGERLVDAALMCLVRHHSRTEQDQEDILAFCSNVVQTNQIAILLRHMGAFHELMATKITVDQVGVVPLPAFAAEIALKDIDVMWRGNGLTIGQQKIPASLIEQFEGKKLSALIEHPYRPGDAIIDKITDIGESTYAVSLTGNK